MERVKSRVPMTVAVILPAFLLIVVAFDVPLAAMLGRSVSFPDITFEHYSELFSTDLYLKVVWNTFEVAAIVTAVCALLGYPLAFWMRTLPPTWQIVAIGLVVVPFWISVLIRTYAWIAILGNGGIVNSILLHFGLVAEPVTFLYSKFGVIVGIANVLLPFLVLPLFAAMVKLDERLLDAARTLGGSNWTVFWRVFFPLTLPALVGGALLVLLMSLGFYVTPMILGGGRVPMLVNMLDLLVNRMPNWSLAAAISVVLLIVTLTLYAVSRRLSESRAS